MAELFWTVPLHYYTKSMIIYSFFRTSAATKSYRNFHKNLIPFQNHIHLTHQNHTQPIEKKKRERRTIEFVFKEFVSKPSSSCLIIKYSIIKQKNVIFPFLEQTTFISFHFLYFMRWRIEFVAMRIGNT